MVHVLGRVVGVVAGALLAWAGLTLAHTPYEERVHYPQARPCADREAAASPHGCLGRTSGRVIEKGRGTGTFWLRVRWASGAEKQYNVEGRYPPCYDAARRGSHAGMVTWRGKLMRLTVRGETCEVSPHAGAALLMAVLLAWAGVGLALVSLAWPGRDPHLVSLRCAAWMGICFFGYFPGIRLAAGGERWWIWALCLPLAAACAIVAFLPLRPRSSPPANGSTRR
ncbi:hypothetical protein AB0J57_00195 [Streptomyces sp. NPDC049837]|uniref:hypothetical protein n=1 Tax=Streptomyces sp. NPDC049837 TaxID=3155277 RepID=UPI003444AAB5